MKLTYRPEIDGLRGIAVVAVILYHAQISLFDQQFFKGGFIGVDIFFVISGYLITSLILKELETTKKFSFLYFYERRSRRILPALFVVKIAFLPFAWMYLLPPSFVEFSESILSSLFFSSNIYFAHVAQSYGAGVGIHQGLRVPFIHTWSLSVEEQFYVIFPAALLIAYKYFKKYLIHLIIIGIIVSLVVADWSSNKYVLTNFYLLPTRGWELLAGAMLAKIEIKYGRNNYGILNQTLPIVGLLLIAHSFFWYHDTMPQPSFYTISPIIGVCLVIWFSNKDEAITKILSSKLLVGAGLISYSLYLWHYPIFSFSRIIEFTSGSLLKNGLLAFILIFTLSILSYFFIEKPFRNKRIVSLKLLMIAILGSLIFLTLINIYVIQKNGVKERITAKILVNHFENSEYRRLAQNKKNYVAKNETLRMIKKKFATLLGRNKETCHNRVGSDGFCIFNSEGKNGNIYLLGDSITDSLAKDFIIKSKIHDFKLIHMSYSGNLFLPNYVLKERTTGQINMTAKAHENRLQELINSHKNSYVIISADYPLYFYGNRVSRKKGVIKIEEFHEYLIEKDTNYINNETLKKNLKIKFEEAIIDLANMNKKIILLYPLPQPFEHISQKIVNLYGKMLTGGDEKEFKAKITNSKLNIDYDFFIKRNKEIFQFFDEINHKNIFKIYPHKLFCNTKTMNKCLMHDDENIFFFDDVHPSFKGSDMINELIFAEIKRIEEANK